MANKEELKHKIKDAIHDVGHDISDEELDALVVDNDYLWLLTLITLAFAPKKEPKVVNIYLGDDVNV